jgi:peroxiredoxin
MKKITSFLAWLVALTLIPSEIQAEAVVGKPAPAFTLKSDRDQTVELSQYRGKFVVLEWINHGCPFVKKHYDSGNMQKLQKSYEEKGVIWLSICSSAPGQQGNMTATEWVKTTAEKKAAPTAVLLDADGKVGRSYGAKTTPHLFVINPGGDIIYAGAIDSISSADPADIAQAKNYVQVALDEALAGKPVTTSSTRPYGCSVKYAR